MKKLSVDESKCIGCRICEYLCSLIKEGSIIPSLSRIKILSDWPIKNSIILCKQCEDPECAKNCPVSAISADSNGLVIINENKCIGCSACVQACPYDAIKIHPAKKLAIKCDLCNGEPVCAINCMHGALTFSQL
ncbi:MAG: 4Fe-4S dicluster domain-containing protein [Candidatus Bathyarchaeia archaeon]